MPEPTLIDESSRTQTGISGLVLHRRVPSAFMRRLGAMLVFVLSFLWFAASVEDSGIASMFCDPVSRIPSQDEAVYGREAIEMASHGNWLTPTYLGRFVLNKPPLMQSLVAASVRIFGPSALSLRLPSLLAAALIAAILFSLAWRLYSLVAAIAVVLLLASSHLFYVFARFCMTDMLLSCWLTLAMVVLALDPALRRSRYFWMFSVCSGAAIMTKAAAGILPLLALVLHTWIAPREVRPNFRRVAEAVGAAAVVALPWHLYQLVVHTRWFIAEYVWTAHLMVGLAAPPQYSDEMHPVFYARRMFLMDPVLTLFAAAGVVLLLRNGRRRSVTLAWISAAMFGLFAFRYRSAYYLLPVLPAFAFSAAETITRIPARARWAVIGALAACSVVKTVSDSPLWGIPANVRTERVAAAPLEQYCGLHRGNGLIIVDPNDEFYASILPIARVRYALLKAEPPSPPIDYAGMGIWLPAARFAQIEQWIPVYRDRLRFFGLDSERPIGSVIWAQSPAEIDSVIDAHPESDFSIPASMAWRFHPGSHSVQPATEGRVFLLSKTSSIYAEARACGF